MIARRRLPVGGTAAVAVTVMRSRGQDLRTRDSGSRIGSMDSSSEYQSERGAEDSAAAKFR
jgi:hypothetical protein